MHKEFPSSLKSRYPWKVGNILLLKICCNLTVSTHFLLLNEWLADILGSHLGARLWENTMDRGRGRACWSCSLVDTHTHTPGPQGIKKSLNFLEKYWVKVWISSKHSPILEIDIAKHSMTEKMRNCIEYAHHCNPTLPSSPEMASIKTWVPWF